MPDGVSPDRPPRRRLSSGVAPEWIVWIGISLLVVARLPLLAHRTFDWDEFEHAHAAWCWWKGMLPYRDFFEHHTPWYYLLLRPLFDWFAVDASLADATRFLIAARVLSLALTGLSLLLIVELGRQWRDRRVGVLAAFLLVGQPFVFQKTLEARPDVPAMALFLTCLWCLVRALRTPRGQLRGFVSAGLALGAAVMFTQKMLFVLPGMAVVFLAWVVADERPARLRLGAVFLAGLFVPGLLTWAWFSLHHDGGAFLANNFLLNATWKPLATPQFRNLLMYSAPILILALLAAVEILRQFFRTRRWDPADLLLLATLVGLFAGVAVIPVAQQQYYLMPVPIACLLAAWATVTLIDRLPPRRRTRALLISLLALSILPAAFLGQAYGLRNDRQLARLGEIFARTGRTDLVMDGFEGTGVFRPHAFYYFFIHTDLRPMLSPARLDAYLDDLERGRVRPRVIALDKHLVSLGPRFLDFVNRNYSSEDGFLYYRNR